MEQEPLAKNYFVYLRKSEDDPKKQVRSVEDQKSACLDLAKRYGIKIQSKNIIVDEKSAKRSGNRPKFTEMIKIIKKKKMDGIIAWHPDRLARNMKEAGEIIDLLDEGYLKDLRFASHHFVNDYQGKMALGISFVLAKQYTDKLSVDVKRGLDKALQEGKSAGQYKAGYIRDENTKWYEPNEELTSCGLSVFHLIRQAWEKRMAGETLQTITDFLNESGYKRRLKNNKKIQRMSASKLGNMFNDKLYYGILEQGGHSIDLSEIYDFTATVSEEEFLLVQGLGRPELRGPKHHNYPFKTLLKCMNCAKQLTAGAPQSRNGTKYLRYWCNNKSCEKVSIRAKDVIDHMMTIMENLEVDVNKHYQSYTLQAELAIKEQRQETRYEKAKLTKLLNQTEANLKDLVLGLTKQAKEMGAKEKAICREEIKKLQDKSRQCKRNIEKIEQKERNMKPLDTEEFLNQLKTLATSFKFANASEKDSIAQNMFLNLTINKGKIASFKLKEPFASMLKDSDFQSGGPGWT